MTVPSFHLEWEWLSGEHVPVASHARTWARLEITLGEQCATRVEDLNARTVRDAVRGPLMPLAEWIVSNWFFILHESPQVYPLQPARGSHAGRRDWFRRHNLLFAREGFPLPDLTFARANDELLFAKLARDPRPMGQYPVRFTEDCEALVPGADVRDRLRALVEAVIDRLDGCDTEDAIELREAWSAIQALSGDDRTLSVRAAAMGLDGSDPEEVDDAMAAELVDRLSTLPEAVVGDLLEVPMPASELALHVDWVERARSRASAPRPALPMDIEAARNATEATSTLTSDAPAYRAGWDLAARTRERLFRLDDKAHGRALTAKLEAWVSPFGEEHTVEALRGWVGVNGSIVAAVEAPEESTRRWLTARALCMTLLGGRERLVTDAQSWAQSVARAFATELVAPCALLRDRVLSPVIRESELRALSDELVAPPRTVEHQLENHGIAVVEP